MSSQPKSPITQLLDAAGNGDLAARERLWKLLYDELHRVAHNQMKHEPCGHALQTTALISEAYLRLVGEDGVQFANRRHFFAAAANAMRRIRVDYARKRDSLKRGGDRGQAELEDVPLAVFDQDADDVIAIDEALSKLEGESPTRAEVVKLRYFAGLSRDEIAGVMEISVHTVDKYWRLARNWLHRELSA